jgi:type II secretion system protein G
MENTLSVGRIYSGRTKRAFTLMELLIVIIVIAVLAAIALPKFGNSSTRSREASLRAHLRELRRATIQFQTETGAFPATLDDLAVGTAPAAGLDSAGSAKSIIASDWHGPYIQQVNPDPVSGSPFTYSVTSPTVGKITSSASGTATDGTNYSTW